MAAFVLVHGAWAGGWCWRLVTPLLRAAGHDAHTVTLTGLGDRAHLGAPSVTMETHVRDVVAAIESEDLRDVVLVGHSYGCIVITGAYGEIGERVRRLVYLDGPVPRSGQTMADLIEPEPANFIRNATIEAIPPPRVDDPAMAWYMRQTRPQPINTLRTPVTCDDAAVSAAARTYVSCTQSEGFHPHVDELRADPAWRVREIESDHFPMVRCPQALADLLLAEAEH